MNSENVRPREFDHALEVHYRRFFDKLVSQLSKGRGKDTAQDIVQEAYTRALERWEEYDPQYDFATWFGSKILPNERIKDNKRERNHSNNLAEDITEEMEGDIDRDLMIQSADPEEKLYAKEVLQIIANKPAVIREILHDALVLGEDYNSIAKNVGRSPKAIRMIVYKFRKEMQNEASVL